MLTRRQSLGALTGSALASVGQSAQKPNFVILFTDDQRYGTIRALGNREVHTPNMDRLVKRGVAFTNACIMGGTQGAVCVASRAMLMTGQTLFRATRNTEGFSGEAAAPGPFHLLPEVLRQNGYSAFHTGKWHNGPKLFARAFGDGGNIFFGGMGDQLKMPVQDFDPSGVYPKERIHPSGRFSSELFADTAIGFLKKQTPDKPFLLYCAFTSPHDPRMAPKRFADLYDPSKISLPPNFLPRHPFDNGELEVRDELLAPFPRTAQVVREHIAAYYGMISEVDHEIGRILDVIDRSRFARNTYVIFAEDNGLALGQHGLLGKQNMYEHSVRVPLVIAGPTVPKNKRSDGLVYLLDMFPTICQLAAIPIPGTVEGKPLLPLGADNRDSLFFAYRDIQRAVRTREWKLIRYTVKGKETLQLFQIARDPWEMNDLADQPDHGPKVREMLALLRNWQTQVQDPLLK